MILASSGLVAAACHPRTTESPPADPPPATSAAPTEAASALAMDAGRMLADITTLAADEMRGRFTLSEELGVSARMLSERYAALGLGYAAGSSFEVPFPMVTGVKELEPTRVTLTRGKSARALADDESAPVALSGSAEVTAQMVFVGYAARAEAVAEAEGQPAIPGYDDLEGVDVRGKIAVLLLESPGRPNLRTFFNRLQREREIFDREMGGLRERGDVDGIRKLHAAARKRLIALLTPFMPGAHFDDLWPMSDDPLKLELDLSGLFGSLMREVAKLKGPRFDLQAGRLRTKLDRLIAAGAVGAIVVRGPRSFVDADEREADAFEDLSAARLGVGEPLAIPVVQLKWKSADKHLRVGGKKISDLQAKIDRELKPRSGAIEGASVTISTKLEAITRSIPNVLAVMPGTDLADEIVMIGAHYDHIGADDGVGECSAATASSGERDTICNGADDNASGTAMVLEAARALVASGHKPRRTIVFTHFAGEELGLRGSQALAESAPFELTRVKAMINLDMVGRLGPRGLAVGGIGSADAWMPLLERAGTHGMSVLYEASVATRSDHASFYRKQIPVLFFFTGVHGDYHRPGDHSDKINQVGLQKIGDLVGEVLVALADGLPIAYAAPKKGDGLSGGLPGSDPETVIKRVRARGDVEAASP
ncbi:MAG: M20/M25/M40 family metallo-hydrolase [Nannocystaceae bacterium]